MANNITTNAHQFRFELVAPEKVELSGLEEAVSLPGEMGNFTVLAGHTPLLAGLRPGVVSVIRSGGKASQHFYISGGFVDIGNTHCIVLTPHVMPTSELNLGEIDAAIATLTEKRKASQDMDELDAVEQELDVLTVKRDAAIKYGA